MTVTDRPKGARRKKNLEAHHRGNRHGRSEPARQAVLEAADNLPDRGDVGADLRAYLRKLALFLTTSDAGAVFRAIAGQCQHDQEVAARFRAEYLVQQRDRDRAPILRAIERGELSQNLDVELAIDELVGPIYYRVLVTGRPVPREFTDRLVDHFLALSQVR